VTMKASMEVIARDEAGKLLDRDSFERAVH
jgi:hypothetical protein